MNNLPTIQLQKFNTGDYVKISQDLPYYMRHFTKDCEAIICYSYADNYGGNNITSYSVYIKGWGTTAWYPEETLTLIQHGCIGILNFWRAEKRSKDE